MQKFGRDGQPSTAILYSSDADVQYLAYWTKSRPNTTLDEDVLEPFETIYLPTYHMITVSSTPKLAAKLQDDVVGALLRVTCSASAEGSIS